MVVVVFVQSDGSQQQCEGPVGDTVMDVALDNNVPGIVAQCGGGCTCCTCHCWVDEFWLPKLEQPHQDELDMLAYAWGHASNSRLACQVPLYQELSGIVVTVPAQQS